MNNKKILTLSILVLLFVSFVAPISLLTFLKNLAKSNYIPAVITSVSTSQTDQNDSLRRGSLLGGNTLFIQGLGLITRLSDIEIIIGDNLECPVNLALSSVFQTACTVPAGDAGSYPITVLINGYEAYCPSSICYYVYDTGYTPVFQHIVPNAITPNKGIKIGGLPRVGQSSSLFANFDQYSCVFGYYGNQDLAPNSLSFSKCQIGNLPVGYYTASFSSSCQGKSWKMKSISLIADLIFNAFDLIVVPEITGLNSNTGSSSVAEIITISGTGFSNKLSDNVVYFEGKGCGVVSSNYNQIKCSLSDPPTVQPQGSWRPGHCGLYQKTWGLQKLAALRSNSAFLKYVGLFNRLVSFEIPYNNGGGEFTGALESFFKAPVSGDYQFYLSAQGSAELYMSTTPLSKDNLVKIAEIVNGTEFRNFFNPLENNQISNTIRLEAGQFYFMQALHMAQGAEHLTVGVRVPTNQKYSMSLGEVISVKVQADVQRLETILTLTNSADLLQFLYVNGNKILRSRYFAFTSPDSIIVNALADVGIEAVVLSQTLLNSNGKVITSGTAAKVQYRLRFYTDSTLSNLPGLNKATAGTLVKATDVTPTALVSGSFKLAFSNKVISLNFDSTADDVEDAFNAAFSSKFSFKAYRYGRPEEGAQWIVYFDRNLGNIPTGRVSSSSLKGGKSGASAGLSVLQDGNSNNVLLAPITPSLLYTPEETSQVSVSVSGIRAVCSGNCSYSYTPPAPSMPTIFNFKWSGSTITINITNSGVTNASLFDELRFGGSLLTLKVVICHLEWLTLKSFVASTGTLSCSIPTNPDGTAMIAAGIWSPIVHILNVGYVKSSASVIKIQIKPTIDTITTQQIATGFLQFTIIGTGFGFGLSSSDSFGTTVNIGGVSCTLTYLSNIKITCNAHLAVTDGPVNITVNNVTASAAFVKKQPPVTLDVSGDCYLDLYGTFTNATVVSLVNNATNAVESCRTCERDNTFIRCSTCGLAPGNYTALMTTFTAPNTLKQSSVAFDIPFNVYSISPQSGSQLGGTILTITGKGFSSTVNENQVSIGSLQCKVISSTATQLKCITTANTAALTGPQDVYAYVKLEFASSCLGNCSFTYSNDFTPQVSQASSTYLKSGDQITLTGKLFSSTSQVILDGFVATIVSMTSTQLVFKVPAIQANTKVNFTVTDPAYGNYYIDSSLVFSSALVLQDVNPKTGSKGGAVLTLTGFGFSSSASVTIGSAQCQILQVSTTQITCKAPASSQGTVSITQTNFSAVTCNGCTYQYDDNLTPTVTSMTVQDTIDALTITLQGTLLNVASPVTVSLVNNDLTQPLEITQTTSNTIIATFCGTISGTYNLDVRVGNNLVLYQNVPSQQVNVTFTQASVPTNNQIISQAGGNSLVLNLNQGFLPSNPSLVSVKIAGFDCPIEFANRGRISCVIPPLRLPGLRQLATEKFLSGNWIVGNANDQPALAFDDNTATSFKGTDNNCFVGIDVGQNLVAEVSQVQFFPKIGLDLSQLYGSVIEGSNDGLAWTVFSTISSSVYSGFNTITFAAGSRPLYRYLRFRQASAISKCELAELKFKGTLFSGLSVSNTAVVSIPNVQVTINGLMQEFVANIQYRQDITPTVSAVSPAVGSSIGGTVITITGTGFGTDKTGLEVYLDDIECTVSSVQNTAIVCTTGALPDVSLRTSTPKGIVNVYVGDNGLAMNTNVRFLYAERWSDVKTWGCGGLPIEGDSVEIPVGMNLLVDMSPPKLVAVVVEGGLIFEDKNINFGCEYIMVRNGSVRIGTETAPIQSNITLTLYGDRDDEQLPIFGNKAFGMYEGRIDIHGAERSVLNTFLASTASAGSSVIIVVNAGDWKAGETIVISSTSLVASQNEKKTIASVSGNTITLTSALAYTHLGESKTVSGSSIGVKAVVSLLNRNIVIKGDDSSLESNYGAHMLFYDPGTQNTLVRISNAEFVNGGQAGFTERYPINFQNAGNQMNSYVSKCSIHSSNNKGLQIKGTQYLQVLNNTFYDIENEAIILTDGVEINNVIQDNVIIQISSSLFVYNSASTSPAISISNPLNFIRRNIIAGVLNNAFNFEFGINSQGGSYSTSICPQGERLGAFEDNYVLSCGGIALFIDNYFPRTFPCGAYRSNNQDPFSLNRPVTATFKNFIAARSMTAVQGLNLGAVVFDSFRIYDSKTGAIEVRHATHAPVNSTQVTNAFIVGNLGLSDSISVSNTWGILTPSDDGFTVNKATFANFDSSSAALQGCSNCANAWEITGSKTTFVQSLTFVNVAKRIAFTAPYYSHIFRDLDGTLTGLTNGGTVVYNFPHLQVPECSLNTAVYSGLVCTSAIELREISFWAVNPEELQDQTLGISRLQQGASLSSFSSLSYHYPQKGFSAPFATGYPYQAFFSNLLDWTNLTLKISPLYTSKDLPITLTFNYTEPREDFDVIRTVFLQADVNVTNTTTQVFDRFSKTGVSGYSFGDFYNDVANKALYLTVTGNNVGQPILDENDAAQIKVTAFQCKLHCPAPITSQFPSVTRKWSQADAWPAGKIPVAGENVVIPLTDLVVLDMDTAALGNLEIQGQLLFADNQDSITLTAKQIWVRGSMTAGTMDSPYANQAAIKLTGAITDTPFVVNFAVNVGPRALVVTGFLSFVGQPVNGVARLGANGNIGDNKILISGDISPFKKGDKVAIAPSGSNANEYETKTITDINYDTMIVTLDSGLQYFHYGSDSMYMGSDGMTMVDMRAEVVPMSRNVRIQGLDDGLGAVILATQEYNSATTVTGRIDIENALISNCGQTGTDRAAIIFELANSDQGSVLSGNVIYNSLSYGIRFTKSTSVNAMNNVIFKAKHIGILFEDNNQLIMVINNLIFGITPNARGSAVELSDFSAGIYLIDGSNANSVIAQNTVAGCSFSCYFILAPSCSIDNFFVQNIAHSGRFGYIAYGDQESCVSISGFTAYRTTYGVISYYRIAQIQASSLVLIDNTVSLNLASSSSADLRKISVTDSYFAGIALLNCPQCYADTQCSNQAAIGLNDFTTDIWPDVYSTYTTSRSSVLGSAYDFERNYFENFQDGLFASSPQCKGNNIFKTSQYATDYIPFVTVSQSTTKYVDSNSIVKFVASTGNDQNCGAGVPCTLVKNTLIKDLDGSLIQTPNPGALLPLTSEGAKASVCTSQTSTSICKSSAYALLGFKNLDTDKSQINLDPVFVANSNGFNNTVYSHRDNNPLESDDDTQKYISTVQSNSSYNVSFSNDIPVQLDFELQGQDSDYSILTIQYNTSKSIKVVNAITGATINPSITMPTSSPQILPSHPCGTYIFNRDQNYVQFKVTGESSCKLLVQQTNSVIANIRYDIAVDDFFSAGGIAPFIDKLAAVLNIPSIRIRVVEIYKGSTGIIITIDSEIQGVGSKSQASAELVDLSNNLEQAISSGSLDMYNAPVLSFSQKTVLAESHHKTTVSFMSSYKFYLVVIGAPVIIACIAGFLIYKYKVKGKKKPALKIKPRKISTKTLDLPDAMSATSSLQVNPFTAAEKVNSGFKSDDDTTPKNGLIEKNTPVSRDQKRRSQMLRLGGSLTDANKNLMSNAGSIGSIGALEEIAKLTKNVQSPSKDRDDTPFATTRTMVPLMEVIPENPLTTTRQISIDNDVEFETVNDE